MKLNERKILEILLLRKRIGVSIKELANMYNVTPRRIQQVISRPAIRKPGRKRECVPLRTRERVISLRKQGFSIRRIHQELRREGLQLSRYKTWRIIKEYEESMDRKRRWKECHKTQTVNLNVPCEKPLVYIDVAYLPEDRRNRLFVVIKLPDTVIHAEIGRITLRNVLEVLSTMDLSNVHLLIGRVPPLVPTRCSNRLVKYLERRNVGYTWVDKLMKLNVCSYNLYDILKPIEHRAYTCFKAGIMGDITEVIKRIEGMTNENSRQT